MAQTSFDTGVLGAKYFSVADLLEAFDQFKNGDPTEWGLLSNGVSFNCFGPLSEGWDLVVSIHQILEKTEEAVEEVGLENVFVIPTWDVERRVAHYTFASTESDDFFQRKMPTPREIAVPH